MSPSTRPARARRSPLALLAASWLLVATAARAELSSFDLQWQAPPGCPQGSDVQSRVEALVGAEKTARSPVEAEGNITQTDDGRFQLKLVIRSGGLVGERALESTSCEDLAGAAAVTLGLAMRSNEQQFEDAAGATEPIGPPTLNGASGASESPDDTATKPEKPANAHDERETVPALPVGHHSEVTPRSDWHVLIQAPLVAVSVGPLPGMDFGLGWAAGASFGSWRAFIEGEKWLEQNVPAENFPEYGADVDRSTLTVRACRALQLSPSLDVAPCLLLSVEHISARGTGEDIISRSQKATWVAPGAGAQGRLSVTSWLRVVATIDGRVEASRPQIAIDGLGTVDQLGPAALTVTVGPEWIP
jgi:hypothetical protein